MSTRLKRAYESRLTDQIKIICIDGESEIEQLARKKENCVVQKNTNDVFSVS